VELVTGIVILSKGSTEQKAELVFKAIDRNNDGSLTKTELERYVNITYNAVQTKIIDNSKRDGLPWIMRQGLSLGLSVIKPTLKTQFIEKVFEADTDGDGKVTLAEFKAAATNNDAIAQLLSPDKFVSSVYESMDKGTEEAGLVKTGDELKDVLSSSSS
jgi:Ca2+-binding EF-hand superfamily protein